MRARVLWVAGGLVIVLAAIVGTRLMLPCAPQPLAFLDRLGLPANTTEVLRQFWERPPAQPCKPAHPEARTSVRWQPQEPAELSIEPS